MCAVNDGFSIGDARVCSLPCVCLFGLGLVYSAPPACHPAPLYISKQGYCQSPKAGAQAVHQHSATRLPGPPVASALCVGRQINEVFAVLWQSCAFQKVNEGKLSSADATQNSASERTGSSECVH